MSTTWHERLKEKRLALGLTKTELGKRCGVSQPTAQHWESGEIKTISRDNSKRLAEVLETTESWLFEGILRNASDTDQLGGLTPTQRIEVQDLIDNFRNKNDEARRLVAELDKAGNGN
jgi:transcriptional regulator with XRE-family HTH domain